MPAAKTKRQISWVRRTNESRCLTNLSMLVKPRKSCLRQGRRLHASVVIARECIHASKYEIDLTSQKEFGSTVILGCVLTAPIRKNNSYKAPCRKYFRTNLTDFSHNKRPTNHLSLAPTRGAHVTDDLAATSFLKRVWRSPAMTPTKNRFRPPAWPVAPA